MIRTKVDSEPIRICNNNQEIDDIKLQNRRLRVTLQTKHGNRSFLWGRRTGCIPCSDRTKGQIGATTSPQHFGAPSFILPRTKQEAPAPSSKQEAIFHLTTN